MIIGEGFPLKSSLLNKSAEAKVKSTLNTYSEKMARPAAFPKKTLDIMIYTGNLALQLIKGETSIVTIRS